jgi:hypothetical protein
MREEMSKVAVSSLVGWWVWVVSDAGREADLPSNWRHKLAATRHPRLADPAVWKTVFGAPHSWRTLADSGNLTPYDYISHDIKFS